MPTIFLVPATFWKSWEKIKSRELCSARHQQFMVFLNIFLLMKIIGRIAIKMPEGRDMVIRKGMNKKINIYIWVNGVGYYD